MLAEEQFLCGSLAGVVDLRLVMQRLLETALT
jgi:hypothetical protein